MQKYANHPRSNGDSSFTSGIVIFTLSIDLTHVEDCSLSVKCSTTEIMFSTKAFGQENGKPNKHADIHYICYCHTRGLNVKQLPHEPEALVHQYIASKRNQAVFPV